MDRSIEKVYTTDKRWQRKKWYSKEVHDRVRALDDSCMDDVR